MTSMMICAPLDGFAIEGMRMTGDYLMVRMRQIPIEHDYLVCRRCLAVLTRGQWSTYEAAEWTGNRRDLRQTLVPDVPCRGQWVRLELLTIVYRCKVCHGAQWRDEAPALLFSAERRMVQATRRLVRWALLQRDQGAAMLELAEETGVLMPNLVKLVKNYDHGGDTEVQKAGVTYLQEWRLEAR